MFKRRRLENDEAENSDENIITTTSSKLPTNDGAINADKKFPKLLDGKYFKVADFDEETDFVSAKCMNCTKKNTIIRGKRTSTGNFHTHYARVHSDISDNVKLYCDDKKDDKPNAERKTKLQSTLPFANSLDQSKVIVLNYMLLAYCSTLLVE